MRQCFERISKTQFSQKKNGMSFAVWSHQVVFFLNSFNYRNSMISRYLGVSKNSGTPKSSILMGFSIINHPFWGPTPIFGNIQIMPTFPVEVLEMGML